MSSSLIAELLERYRSTAVRHVAAKLGDGHRAEDICQDVIRAILESGRTFESLAHLRNYFFVALRNAITDAQRKRARAREVRLPDEAQVADGAESASGEGRLLLEEELARAAERLERLRRAVDALPPAQRQLLRQRFWERLTFREIGEASGTSISTLKSREDAILRILRMEIGNSPTET